MRIVVISDTHCQRVGELPQKILDEFSKADLILHAGDYTGKQLLEELSKRKFRGVYGNMDPPEICRKLPESEVIEVAGFKIGLIHPAEGGPPFGLEDKLRQRFGDVNVIVYGHTHRAKNEWVGDVLYFNPGSLTGKFPSIHRTYGVITIDGEIEGEIKSV
jgi:putative phosphoesterase